MWLTESAQQAEASQLERRLSGSIILWLNLQQSVLPPWGETGAIKLGVKLGFLYGALRVGRECGDVASGFSESGDNTFGKYSEFWSLGIDKSGEDEALATGCAYGLWTIHSSLIEVFRHHKVNGERLSDSLFFYPFGAEDRVERNVSFTLDSPSDWAFCESELWVSRDDMLKLHNCFDRGGELSNIYNNGELLDQSKAIGDSGNLRVSAKHKEMIRALLLLRPDISEEDLEKPYNLYQQLEAIFNATEGRVIMPDISDRTLANWLS